MQKNVSFDSLPLFVHTSVALNLKLQFCLVLRGTFEEFLQEN